MASTALRTTRWQRSGSRLRSSSLATVAVVAVSLLGTAIAPAQASVPAGRETVAALDPALTAGRGASVQFVEQEAENAATNGQVIGPDRTAYTLPAEASGRTAVKLSSPGQYVEFTLTRKANAVTFRYSIPDAPTGGGIDAPLDIIVNDKPKMTTTVTSKFSWLYAMYPFSNDPNADPNPGWWKPEPDPVAKPFRPSHFYDEKRVLLGSTLKRGDTVRLQVPETTNAGWYVIDLMDFERVAAPAPKPGHAISILEYGADPTGGVEASDAIDATIAAAKAAGKTVFMPAGRYQVNRHIVVDKITIRGAGNWHTVVFGKEVTLPAPLPDQSIHTGVGFYGKYMEAGGSSDVHLSNFAIMGDVRERIDTDQVNGVGGAIGGGSTIERLFIQHTKVGLWFDGPFDGLLVRSNIVVDQIADGINFRRGVTNSRASNNFFRNTGDDAMAMWSHFATWETPAHGPEMDEDRGNTFDHNTIQTPVLANGIAIYGGRDNTVANNLVADPIREGSGLHAGQRFGATPFAGYLKFTDNTTVRSGPLDLNWNIGLGAIWLFALEGSMTANIEIVGDHFLDNTYNAIMLVVDWPVKDKYRIENVKVRDVKVDGTGTSVVNARVGGTASFKNVDARNVGAAGINNCGTFNWGDPTMFYNLVDLGGNDGGWMGPSICDDRPPVVPPPPPSPW